MLKFRREVFPSDPQTVEEIVRSTGFFSPAEVKMARELVEERLSKGLKSGYYFLFAETENEVVGYGCFGPIGGTQASFDLYWIAVNNKKRGQKIGSQILAACEKEIKAMGGEKIYIETSSRHQYNPTRFFYKKMGYIQEAILKDFYGPGDSKIIFVKYLAKQT